MLESPALLGENTTLLRENLERREDPRRSDVPRRGRRSQDDVAHRIDSIEVDAHRCADGHGERAATSLERHRLRLATGEEPRSMHERPEGARAPRSYHHDGDRDRVRAARMRRET